MSRAMINALRHENQFLKEEKNALLLGFDDLMLMAKSLASCLDQLLNKTISDEDLEEINMIYDIWLSYTSPQE
jgi:hypothetical protein